MRSYPDSVCSSPTISEQPSRRNVLIFGDVGAGKSSLVNLITGSDRAKTSGNAKSCTLESTEYTVTLDGVELALYDTAGMHEAQGKMETSEYLDAIYQAHALISRLERAGGINLLVFVMRAGRISVTAQQTYALFAEVLCTRQVPVVIAVTHLEEFEDMEEWWRDNEDAFNEYGLRSFGHACVTATRGFRNVYIDKYEQSKEIIRKLLLECSGRVWKEDRASWVKRVVLHMRAWLSPRRRRYSGRELKKKLVNQCGFSPKDADTVARRIEHSRGETKDTLEEKPWFDQKFPDDGSSIVSSLPEVPYDSSK